MKRFGLTERTLEEYLDGCLGAEESARIDDLLDRSPEFQRYVDEYVNMSLVGIGGSSDENGGAELDGVRAIGEAMNRLWREQHQGFEYSADGAGFLTACAESAEDYGEVRDENCMCESDENCAPKCCERAPKGIYKRKNDFIGAFSKNFRTFAAQNNTKKKTTMSKIKYIGCDDADIDIFESQYPVPQGVSYNSYLLEGAKVAVMDTADPRRSKEWLGKLDKALNGRKPDYLVVHHMEPDHSGTIGGFMEKYPETTIVCSVNAQKYMLQFNEGLNAKFEIVKEGSRLDLGNGVTLDFVAAPMVHWPEVLMSYMAEEKTLFAADGFGKFGVYDADPENWADEARRYYFNICGKYGVNVASVLKKASGLQIERICPLHGPVLEGEKMAAALGYYVKWSAYEPEAPEAVLVAYASIHGNTARAARHFAEVLKRKGAKEVVMIDLTRTDVSYAISEAFRVGRVVVAASTYDAGLFPPMHCFLYKLSIKGYQKRRFAIIENGTWAPMAGKLMRGMLEGMKDIEIVEPMVTLMSSMQTADEAKLSELAGAILK